MTSSQRNSRRKIRVAVVDDSTFIRKAITRMLQEEADLTVVGSAGSGEELLTHLEEWAPDVVTLDLDMPGMGGLATLDRLTALGPLPVIILSTHSGKGAPLTIEALHRGATDFIDKQRYSLVDFGALRSVLLEKILQVTGHPRGEVAQEPPPTPITQASALEDDRRLGEYDIILLGASTGGPPVLQTILEVVGKSVPVPIVIVQHMPLGFTQAFAERLNAYLPLVVREAYPGEILQADTVYIARAGEHLRIRRREGRLMAEVGLFPKNLTHMPSVDVLFESAARAVGRRAVAALLTGMGSDGAKGLAALKAAGAYTLCQDEASSIVFGMPRAAMSRNAAREVGDPDRIGRRLSQLVTPAPS
ncbi:MAG: chemotaxis-specific protein-glutamate methyltransferase CheB [Thermoanaerobaculia bacterium]|nr:chemotaxis-specific protein-glutamate methyltransferase CheB [Thermoanaerobaculia bacterium]